MKDRRIKIRRKNKLKEGRKDGRKERRSEEKNTGRKLIFFLYCLIITVTQVRRVNTPTSVRLIPSFYNDTF